jgi:hypothetical protein
MFFAHPGGLMRPVLRGTAAAGLVVAALAWPVLATPVLALPAQASASPVDITPNPSAAGTSTTFAVNCSSLTAAGKASSATLIGTSLGLSEHIPMQASTHAGEFVTTVTLPAIIKAGTYQPVIDCSDGVTASAVLTVTAVPAVAPATGDGTTATAADARLTAIGLALLGLGAVSGAAVITRRRLRGRA